MKNKMKKGIAAFLTLAVAASNFAFAVSSAGAADVKLGDVNLDGEVELEDAVLLQKNLAGFYILDASATKAADIDKNGDVELEDAVLLQKNLAGFYSLEQVESVSLNKTSLTLNAGDTYTLVKTITPAGANDNSTWKSDNEFVATVDSVGKVTAKAKGTATITVTTANGKTASCVVTVNAVDKYEAYVNQVINIVNEERAKVGLQPLAKNDTLCEAAEVRAKEIVTKFDHTRPDGSSCFTVLGEFNINYWYVGENIAKGQSSPEAVMNSWMNSSGHKENILTERYNNIGVGCYESGGTLHWVQLFIQGV